MREARGKGLENSLGVREGLLEEGTSLLSQELKAEGDIVGGWRRGKDIPGKRM